jgi:hypothetical protein
MAQVIIRLRAAFNARLVVALVVLVASWAMAAAPTGTISEAQFTDLATQILAYLGYAIVAGLTVLVAVVGARRAWSFLRSFF